MESTDQPSKPGPSWQTGVALFLLSAATLLYEINLTRLFSVAQFYHFAFVVVSLALLGFGASGTFLSIFPYLARKETWITFPLLALSSSISMLAAYLLMNWLPFDSFSLAWDRRQIFYLILNYLALVTPFFFSGLCVSVLLSGYAQIAGNIYATNLVGSALGCLCALIAPTALGGEGLVSLSSSLAGMAAIIAWTPALSHNPIKIPNWKIWIPKALLALVALASLSIAIGDTGLRLAGRAGWPWMALNLSPYKSLSYALQYPGAKVRSQRWNAISRVDVIQSAGIRSMPGLSYRYLRPLPAQDALLVDGDDLSPIPLDMVKLDPYRYLPSQLAFILRPEAKTLILEPRGGLDVLTSLAGGGREIVLTESNPLIIEAAPEIYSLSKVKVIKESSRGYLSHSPEKFDVILLSFTSSYHPVRSGAYGLAEDYRYTIQAFQDIFDHLSSEGILVVMRWTQTPPSESLRAFILAVTALRQQHVVAADRLALLRGYNTATLLVKRTEFSRAELEDIRGFAEKNAFDLDYLPGLLPQEANRFNVLPNPNDYQVYAQFINSESPEEFYRAYRFDVRPPSDNQPFFNHFFKWEQTPQILAEIGKTWQPFGGTGYFVMIALLILAGFSAAILILLPLWVGRRRVSPGQTITSISLQWKFTTFLYFGSIGIAYLFVEIPVIQKFILFLGNPAYAITLVLFSLLLFSGIGSQTGERIRSKRPILILAFLVMIYPLLLSNLFNHTLGYPISMKLVLSILVLAPLGFFMGLPFPAGIQSLFKLESHQVLIPWAWGINGAASVIASIIAAMLALSLGFSSVLYFGALSYLCAWITGKAMASQSPVLPPRL